MTDEYFRWLNERSRTVADEFDRLRSENLSLRAETASLARALADSREQFTRFKERALADLKVIIGDRDYLRRRVADLEAELEDTRVVLGGPEVVPGALGPDVPEKWGD